MTGGPLNLSLLSRGVGEVHKNGHEKVDVYLEPEDYYNFSTNPDRFYLPPIHSEYPPYIDASPSFTTRSSREAQEFRVPKTFTTRKGALLLFSEDLAQRNMERPAKRRITDGHQHSSITPATSFDSQVSLKTVEDLANSILKYGAHDRPDDEVYLKFVHARRDNFERQIRPGYSAKRYLSTWTRTWDDSVFDNIIKHGYITERSLYHYNLVVPGLRRRLFHEDLSHMPQPYRLMRNMLMTPGSLSGYTFYRAATQELLEEEEGHDSDSIVLRKRPDNLRNIRVIKTKGGVQEEVAYSDLDRQSQKEVITDLLVKSAVHYALKKQEELYEESIIRAVQSEQNGGGILVAPERRDSSVVREFDMKDAVESLLDSQHGRFAIGADLPEIDDRSHSSDMGGSFKGGAIPSRLVKQHQASHRPSWPADGTDSEKEYMGGVPVVAVRDGSDVSSHSQHSSVPVLPPIRQTLSPIKDVSRETTQHNITLPPLGRDGLNMEPPVVQVHPATPQHSVLTGPSTSDAGATRGLVSRDAADALPDVDEDEREAETGTEGDRMSRKRGDTSGSSVQSSEKGKGKTSASEAGAGDSITQPPAGSTTGTGTTITTKTRTQWKGLRKGPGSQAESVKGSMIMAPDGEIISVGGSVARGAGHTYDVGNISDVMGHHRHEGAGTDESGASDDEPDEWKMAKKLSISQRSESIKKPFKRGSATSSSVSKEEMDRLNPAGRYLLWDQATRVSGESGSRSQRSSVTEKDIMDTLTDHAQRIAESVLSHPAAGADLESDVQRAAEIWAETHPPRPLSRAHSVREFRAEAIEEIMRNRRASSAAPSAAEYRALIKKSLATAAAKAAGLDPDTISDDAEISPELLDALASQKLTPDQLEIVSDSEGRTRIQSRVDLNEVMGGVQDGHLYIAPGKKGEEGIGKRQISIPADKVSVMDDVEFDRISYQGTDVMSEKGKSKSKAGSKAGSIAGGTMADLAEMEGMMAAIEGKVEKGDEGVEAEDDFLKAVQQATGEPSAPSVPSEPRQPTSGKTTPSAVEHDAASQKAPPGSDAGQKTPPTLPDGGPGEKKAEDARSVKSGKTGVSQKSEASKDSKDSKKKEKEEPFVVGKPKEKKPKKEPLPPKKEEKKRKGKKGKKGKKKEEEEPAPAPQPVEEPVKPEPVPEVVEKEPTPREPTPVSSHKPSSPELKTDESDLEFNFVREQSSPDTEVAPQTKIQIPSPPLDEDEKSDAEIGDEEEETNLKSISNREARAAKRAAAAAKRKEEVERRRREKEEQAKREKEEVERQIALQREMEEERRRREEERRIRKQQQKDAEERENMEREESERRQRLEADRERKAKEEYQRKLEEMKRKQHEEEMRKHELMLQRQKEEEERRAEEELMLSQMAEQERLEYERKKREEEEERKRKELEEKLRRAEEAKKAMEEAQRLAEEMARKQAELEARLKFNRALQEEASGLSHAHEINRAFVFSYFELLQWLGLDIPEFELAKLADY